MAILKGLKLPKVTGQTSNAVVTAFDLLDFATPGFCEAINNQGCYLEIVAIARNNATGATATAKVAADLKRLSGTLSLVEAGATTLLGLADLAIAAVTLTTSGTKVQAQVTGVALTTINWTFHAQAWTD